MAMLGRLFRRLRAGEHRGPLAGSDFAAPATITVTSSGIRRRCPDAAVQRG